MMPFMTQPAVAPACYVPKERDVVSQVFNGAQYLQRTMAAGHRRKWTLAWSGTYTGGFVATTTSASSAISNYVQISPTGIGFSTGATVNFAANTVRAARDPNAFAHHCIGVNTDHATQADRVIYSENGARLALTVATPCQQVDTFWNAAGLPMYLGCNGGWGAVNYPYSGLMSEVYYIDGVQLPVSVFGEMNIHGVWVPRPAAEIHAAIAVAGGFGPNGFHLDFSDPLNPGKDVSGKDVSGKGNHFTAVGFDATGKDTVSSTPTNVYATLNPLDKGMALTLGDGGLTYQGTSAGCGLVRSTLPLFDGVYWEATPVAGSASSQCHGIAAPSGMMEFTSVTGMAYWYATMSHAFVNGAEVPVSVAYDTADKLGLAYRAGRLYFRKNGVWVIGDPETATGGLDVSVLGDRLFALHGDGTTYEAGSAKVNFGQRPFAYAPPVGFKPLCTDNLPEPEIKDPGEAFAQVVTTGVGMDAALNALTGHWDSAPYVEIVKRRDASEDWRVRFSDDPGNAWATNNANAKASTPALASAGDYVGYRLRVGARYGVWTAEVDHVNGTATTVSHGLNTARAVVIATRVSAGGGDRFVWHPDLPNGQLLKLNSIAGAAADSSLGAFGVNSFQLAAALPSGTYRVLVLAERVGFLSLSKHIGNGILNGPMVPMDILPLFSITKRCTNIPSNANGWQVHDAARDSGNGLVTRLWVNIPDSDHPTVAQVDFVVGGLKWRDYAIDVNASGETFINIAIGRPIGGVCVAPVPAR